MRGAVLEKRRRGRGRGKETTKPTHSLVRREVIASIPDRHFLCFFFFWSVISSFIISFKVFQVTSLPIIT